MVYPSRNAILRGFFFVVFVLIYLMCKRWMMEVEVVGKPIYQKHIFNHFYLLWTFKQGLLALMYVLWKAIDQNWIGMGRFKHAEIEETERESQRRRIPRILDTQESAPNGASQNSSINADNEGSPLVQATRRVTRPKKKDPTKLLYLLPSMFSQAHVILVYFGYKLTYPSSVIMLTGTAGMFVTLLSLAFLAKQISFSMWFGVVCTTIGFAISGFSDYFHRPRGFEEYGIAAGDLLYTMGQITMTTQMVYEEKFMRKLSIHPMKFLGSEGIYSFVFSLIMLASFCLTDTQYSDLPNNRIEDIADAALQFGNSWKIILAVFGSLISYVVYTYLGMILIKDHGAMARIMIESLGWCLYWTIAVSIKWEQYFITQIPGLVLVPCGVLIFSHIVACPCSGVDGTLDPSEAQTYEQIIEEQNNGYRENQNEHAGGAVANGDKENDDEMVQVEQHNAGFDHGEDVPLIPG